MNALKDLFYDGNVDPHILKVALSDQLGLLFTLCLNQFRKESALNVVTCGETKST